VLPLRCGHNRAVCWVRHGSSRCVERKLYCSNEKELNETQNKVSLHRLKLMNRKKKARTAPRHEEPRAEHANAVDSVLAQGKVVRLVGREAGLFEEVAGRASASGGEEGGCEGGLGNREGGKTANESQRTSNTP
jgi:hypothetical protein